MADHKQVLGRVPNSNDARVEELASEMFERLAKFMRGEIQGLLCEQQQLTRS